MGPTSPNPPDSPNPPTSPNPAEESGGRRAKRRSARDYPVRDYHPRRRGDALVARILVSILKRLLPVAALAIILLIVAWPHLLSPPTDPADGGDFDFGNDEAARAGLDAGGDIDGLAVRNPRYVGVDSENRAYEISAATATQRSKTDAVINLAEPRADILLPGDERVALTAEMGIYDRANAMVNLQGDVTLSHANGYTLTANTVLIDFKARTASSDQPVFGESTMGEISGQGFIVHDWGERVEITGPSRAVLRSASVEDGL